jgi:hypothetical protein
VVALFELTKASNDIIAMLVTASRAIEKRAFGASPYPGGGVNAPAEHAYRIWKEEFDGMCHYGGFFTTNFHPNLTGRAGRLRMIQRLLEDMQRSGQAWFATCSEVAKYALTKV